MCIICVELLKQSMTIFEAESNLREMVTDEDTPEAKHQRNLLKSIENLDFEELDLEEEYE